MVQVVWFKMVGFGRQSVRLKVCGLTSKLCTFGNWQHEVVLFREEGSGRSKNPRANASLLSNFMAP